MTVGEGAPPDDAVRIDPVTEPLPVLQAEVLIVDPEHFTGIVIELHDEEGDDHDEGHPLDCWVTNIDPMLVPAILRQIADGWHWTEPEEAATA